jgi:hypothetical protein
MPLRDGTGPRGLGPGTGRGLGPCGAGRAYGRGYGQGGGYYQNNEVQRLEQEIKDLRERLDQVKKK